MAFWPQKGSSAFEKQVPGQGLTQNAGSGVKSTNHEATAHPSKTGCSASKKERSEIIALSWKLSQHSCPKRPWSSGRRGMRCRLMNCLTSENVRILFLMIQESFTTVLMRNYPRNISSAITKYSMKVTDAVKTNMQLSFIKCLRWLNRVMQDHEARASDLNRKLIFSFFLLFS